MSYPQFHTASGEAYGSYEVFQKDDATGHFWWPCFPGCMPDCAGGEPFGPFETEALARADADDYLPEDEL